MQLWDELKKAALLGLARHPLRPEVLRALDELGVNVAQEPADVLLEAAATVGQLQRASMRPERYPGELPAPAALGEDATLDAAAVRLLQPVFDGEHAAALPEVLRRMQATGKELPGELLPPLFARLRATPERFDALRGLWGARGDWWLRQHPDYRRYARVPPPESWTDGDPAVRRRFLTYLRRYQPAEGRDLLAASWDKLPKEEKAQLLPTLRTGLSAADLPLLQSLTTERTAALRRAAAQLRIGAGEEGIRTRFERRFREVFSRSGSTSGPVVQVTVPTKADEHAYADGLVAQRQPKRWQKDYLAALLAAVPVGEWAGLLGIETAELPFALLRTNEHATLFPAYLDGTVDTEALTALWTALLSTANKTLQRYTDAVAQTAERLPAATVDDILVDYVTRQQGLITDGIFWTLLFAHAGPWSNTLALALLKPFQRYLRTDQFRLPPLPAYRQLLKIIGYRIDPQLQATIEPGWYTFGPAYGQWEQEVDALHRVLLFRRQLLAALG